ncbi:MAG: threonine dehydratase [Gemmatimonadetes bacterium]|nr:threonine dehydratase [Gemmatimonadota bacterium]
MTLLSDLESAADIVYRSIAPTPQFRWPLLCDRTGTEVWVKHENHTPIGSFKVRGGLVYLDWLRAEQSGLHGVVAATRGNFGQSIAFAARIHGLKAAIVVPQGNSVEKNAAMRSLGAELIEHGRDFQEAYEFTGQYAQRTGYHFVTSFHPLLWHGTASYGLELLRAVPGLETVYVPIGQGSGICGVLAARDALGLKTAVVGVVPVNAPAYALSLTAGKPVATDSADTIADGMACRVPDREAFEIIRAGAERIVTVSEAEIRAAMRHYFTDTHNVAEGAGAAPLAALLQEKNGMKGKKVALILSGGNVDASVYREVL